MRTRRCGRILTRLGLVAIAANVLLLACFAHAEPLLTTRWGQSGDYARFSPNHLRLGCWSTAFAQIMYYHRLAPSGSVAYHCSTGYSISENFDSYSFNWDLFVNSFNAHTQQASINEVAKYSYYASVAIQKDFGTGDYVLSHDERADAIAEYYNCETHLYRNWPYNTMSTIRAIIREELDSQCPVMMHLRDQGQDNYHAVVIDDYELGEDFMVHLNMGHEGADDGWYDFDSPILGYDDNSYRRIITVTPIPEPSTLVLLVVGVAVWLLRRRA